MNENAYRARAEKGQVQIGTWVTMIRTPAVGATIINYSSDAAVLRSSYAATVDETRRSVPAGR